jgi:LPXTG-motif cell wall-anchored protein
MKKLALALIAISATVFGLGLAVEAYPPGDGLVTATPSTVDPGATFTVAATCEPGETATFTFLAQTDADVCSSTSAGLGSLLFAAPQAGTASASFTAPMEPGTYTGNSVGSNTGELGAFSVTVRAPATTQTELPTTGSSGTSTMTIIALGLFAVGAGLFGVSQYRRRTAAA